MRNVFPELGQDLSGSDQFYTIARVQAKLESGFFLVLTGRKLAFEREL